MATKSNRRLEDLRAQRPAQKSRSDEELFIPFVSISSVEKKGSGVISFLLDVNSGSTDYALTKTFKQIALLDETLHRSYPEVSFPTFPSKILLGEATSQQTLEVLKSILSKYLQKLALLAQIANTPTFKQFLARPLPNEDNTNNNSSSSSDASDMFIPVIKVQRYETQQGTIVFVVEANNGARNFVVNRSFADFTTLDAQIRKLYPDLILPNLPPKSQLNEASVESVVHMKHMLVRYLKKIGAFYMIRNGKEYQDFLTNTAVLPTLNEAFIDATPPATALAALTLNTPSTLNTLNTLNTPENASDDNIFIPFTSISHTENIDDCVFFIIEVNSGSKNYNVKRTYKQFETFNQTLHRQHPNLGLPPFPPRQLLQENSSESVDSMRILLAKYLKRIGTFYQITASNDYHGFLTQQNADVIDEDEDMFIPFVSISRAERIADQVFYVVEVNSGSKNYEVKRTFKHFAVMDETLKRLHPDLTIPPFPSKQIEGSSSVDVMKSRLTNYLQKLGGFYQVRNGKEYKRFLTEVQKREAPTTTKQLLKQNATHTSLDHMGQGINEGGLEDDDNEIFIPYVTVPRIEESIFFVIEVNNGSANHMVRRTLKQFAKFDDQLHRDYPDLNLPIFPRSLLLKKTSIVSSASSATNLRSMLEKYLQGLGNFFMVRNSKDYKDFLTDQKTPVEFMTTDEIKLMPETPDSDDDESSGWDTFIKSETHKYLSDYPVHHGTGGSMPFTSAAGASSQSFARIGGLSGANGGFGGGMGGIGGLGGIGGGGMGGSMGGMGGGMGGGMRGGIGGMGGGMGGMGGMGGGWHM